jgi:hypothetical protein
MNNNYENRSQWYDVEYTFIGDHCFLKTLIQPNVRKILEAPCGSGRNIWLSNTQCEVVFVDQEPQMISEVRKKLEEKVSHPNTRAIVDNILNLTLNQTFDLILVPHDSFLLFIQEKDARLALERLAFHLEKNGKLLIDISLLGETLEDSSELPECYQFNADDDVWIFDFSRSINESKILCRNHRQKHFQDRIEIEFSYKVIQKDKIENEYRSCIKLKRYQASEIVQLVKQMGFRIYASYGNYRKEFFVQGMNRLILILEKG